MPIHVHTRKKGTGRNILLYYIDPITGKEVSRSSGTTNKKEAERAAQRWEAELTTYRGTTGTGWAYFRERFENEHLAEKPLKTKTGFITALDHFERLIQLSDVSDVTNEKISKFRGDLIAEKRPVATVANILTHCRTAFKWAERVGMISRCPHFTMPKQVNRRLARGRAIGDAEFAAMLAKCYVPFGKAKAHEWEHALKVLRYSGLRISEAIRLSWDSPPIRISLDAKPHPCIIFFGEGQKSGKDETIPITPALANYLADTPPEARNGPVIVLHGHRRVLRGNAVLKAISAIGETAGVIVSADGKAGSAHDLRRAFGREWASKVKPLVLQRMMRHAAISTTLKYYAHLESEDIGDAIWCPVKSPESSARPVKRGKRKR